MKNRARDILYCGVREDFIRYAKPVLNEDVLKHLYEFMTERYMIHKKKDVLKLPAPWTNNPILQQVKFTNCFREDDRESKNVIANICTKTDVSLKDRFFNIILMRFWNKYESFKLATGGGLISFPMTDETFKACLGRIEANPDHTWWSGAYYTSPVRSWMDKIHFKGEIPSSELNFSASPIYFAKSVLTDELWDNIVACESPKALFDLLTAIPWMGSFLVYQFFVDFTYCEDYWFSENEYTVSGPGCTKGLDLLFDNKDCMTHEECLFWLRDNQDAVFGKFGYDPKTLFDDRAPHDQKMNVMNIENLHCEIQKYMKGILAVESGKKPRGKSNYNGTGISTTTKPKKAVEAQIDLFSLGE